MACDKAMEISVEWSRYVDRFVRRMEWDYRDWLPQNQMQPSIWHNDCSTEQNHRCAKGWEVFRDKIASTVMV